MEGTFKAKVVKNEDGDACVFGESEEKGTPFVSVNFEITQGEHAGEVYGWRGYFTDNTSERTLKSLGYAGFDTSDLATCPGQSPDKEAEIVVEEKPNQDGTKFFTNISWVNSGVRGVSKRMDDKALRMLGAKLKNQAKSAKAPF